MANQAPRTRRRPEGFIIKSQSLRFGKYLVSPLIKNLADGRFHASVSIRSGHGSASHDRVLRLTPLFNSEGSAHHFALREGMAWVKTHGVVLPEAPRAVVPLRPHELPRLPAHLRPRAQRTLLHAA